MSHPHRTFPLVDRGLTPVKLAALALLLGAAGCANATHYRGLVMGAESPGAIVALPTVAQEGNNDCGYSALASVALYHRVDPQRVCAGPVPESFRNARMSAADLVKMAQMLELSAFGYEGTLEDLEKNVGKGRPVLTLLDHPPRLGRYPGLEWWGDLAALPFSIPHWVVVIGFDHQGNVVLHDPNKGLVSMNRRDFADLWKKRSHVAVLVVPKIPAPQPQAGAAPAP